ncbi:hypothetical protein EDC65_5026 [Stella humosa]|uniref:Rap1a immunity protein domain-containing protein n=1 Tax=Stella humosa TaxID=94 RepID=A0A3N1KK17_9PROT|nr:hypothetical protein [Stella humosa]ROP81171.1 hypothetical protein EDC65_5026 [Stella humosa]BBK32517.1 hypothetical protein STHU_31510 [Stella humosa]
MRSIAIALSALAISAVALTAGPALAQSPSGSELGGKLAQEMCVDGTLYYLSADEAKTYETFYVYGVHMETPDIERWFQHNPQNSAAGAYCLRRFRGATPTCKKAVVQHVVNTIGTTVRHVLAIAGPWTDDPCW